MLPGYTCVHHRDIRSSHVGPTDFEPLDYPRLSPNIARTIHMPSVSPQRIDVTILNVSSFQRTSIHFRDCTARCVRVYLASAQSPRQVFLFHLVNGRRLVSSSRTCSLNSARSSSFCAIVKRKSSMYTHSPSLSHAGSKCGLSLHNSKRIRVRWSTSSVAARATRVEWKISSSLPCVETQSSPTVA